MNPLVLLLIVLILLSAGSGIYFGGSAQFTGIGLGGLLLIVLIVLLLR